MKNFANRLLYARELRGLTQGELARAAGISQSAIASYESGKRNSAKNFVRLAHALHVNPLWLIDGLEPMEPALAEPLADYPEGAPNRVLWPFQQVTPQAWESLSSRDKQVVEYTIAAMLQPPKSPRKKR